MENYDVVDIISAIPTFNKDVTTSYIGVPVNVIVACIGGAYSSFSFGPKIEERSRLFNLFFACIIMGAAFTGIANWILHLWEYAITESGQAGLGAFISCITRFVLPEIIKRIGPLMDKIPFIKTKDGDEL